MARLIPTTPVIRAWRNRVSRIGSSKSAGSWTIHCNYRCAICARCLRVLRSRAMTAWRDGVASESGKAFRSASCCSAPSSSQRPDIVFVCADSLEESFFGESDKYYESIDLADAFHPQTILAYEMNDAPLPVPYGAPLRLRLERQLGYKMAKYIMRIEAVESFRH